MDTATTADTARTSVPATPRRAGGTSSRRGAGDLQHTAAATLAKVISNLGERGERRSGQQSMCDAVAAAVASGRHLLAAAGTGTGKSMAYLAPLAAAGEKAVVATATKALQDQLFHKDLPQLNEALDTPLRFALLKGRSNYLCRKKLGDWQSADDHEQGELIEAKTAQEAQEVRVEIRRLGEWADTTHDGDRAGLDFEPSSRAWDAVSVSGRECPGAKVCPSGSDCFAESARSAAAAADVVVVNTHLYCLDVFSDVDLLPPHQIVVFDEAHTLEDIAAGAAGVTLTAGRFRGAARAVRSAVRGSGTAANLEAAGRNLREAMRPHVGELLRHVPHDLADAAALCRGRLDAATVELRSGASDETRKMIALRSLTAITEDLASVSVPQEGDAMWVEETGGGPAWRSAPVDVSAHLESMLWRRRKAAVLTSATVPAGLAATLGVPEGRYDEIDAGSPFDYRSNGLLYCAKHLPDPRDAQRDAAAHAQIAEMAAAAGGRTLALFTSYAAMDKAAAAVREMTGLRVYTQRDLPKQELIRRLSDDDGVCVFATMGMWQGVDVPGRALSLVVVDRLPFPRPNEPLMKARQRRCGPDAFSKIMIPRAATMLAQGAGRLIRAADDRGVVAVLDSRLATASYRWDLVDSLPPFRRSGDLADATAFLKEIRDSGEAASATKGEQL